MNFNQQSLSKIIFWIFSFLLLIIMPTMAPKYGQNGDEDIEMIYGQDVYKYFTEGDMQAVNYDNHPLGMHIKNSNYYGSLINLMAEASYQKNQHFDRVQWRHIYTSILGALMMIFTGLLAYRILGRNWLMGILALLFMAFSPRLFGESMHNIKDIPYASGIIISMYFAISYIIGILQEKKLKYLILQLVGLAFGLTITFGARGGGGLLVIAFIGVTFVAYFLFNSDFRNQFKVKGNFIKFCGFLFLSFIVGYTLAFLCWPYGLETGYIAAIVDSFKEMANRNVDIRVFFEGKYYMSKDMPWYYAFKWIFISSPIIVLLLFVVFVFYAIIDFLKKKKINPILIAFFALFPIIFIIVRKSTIYDTWRHVFFVFPFWAIGAVMVFHYFIQKIKNQSFKKFAWILPVLCLSPEIGWTFTSTPYQYIYFNAFVGGIKGAYGKYDLDYYQTSNRELGRWIKANAQKKADGSKVKIYTNMDGNYDHEYMSSDTSWIHVDYKRYYERHTADYDYYLTYNRFLEANQLQNKQFPPCNAVYTVELKGVPIAAILQRKDNSAYMAFQAMNTNDFATAIQLYEQAFKNDGECDAYEVFYYAIALAQNNRVSEAIDKMNKAIQLDNGRPEFYELLAQLYNAIGDQQNANRNKNIANQLKAKR